MASEHQEEASQHGADTHRGSDLELLGKKNAPALRAKAHESLTLLRWVSELLPTKEKLIPKGSYWSVAARSLVAMWNQMDAQGMNIPEWVQEELVGTRARAQKDQGWDAIIWTQNGQ